MYFFISHIPLFLFLSHHHILSLLDVSLLCYLPSHSNHLLHPDEFKSFLKRLPSTHFLPISSVHLLWGSDWDLQARYRLLQSSLEIQRLKIQRTARKLFRLSIRCHHNPNHQMPRERWVETQPPHHDIRYGSCPQHKPKVLLLVWIFLDICFPKCWKSKCGQVNIPHENLSSKSM